MAEIVKEERENKMKKKKKKKLGRKENIMLC